ncbi:site-specific DNA-methyltransferase [Bacillus anthracis]|uniref:site-specific DNA-methyltransferase n=1 Tax=Bacillus anthracis TaxID=1392 RepID=UPI00268FC047|nr:site-specific DNA-methyltransferase [Bacillus anthracis]
MAEINRLELNWLGKEKNMRIEPRILIKDNENSYNLNDELCASNKLIHGDNLLALKALEQEYTGKVKCVFIDPPYNTGNAFEHYDDGLEHSIWLSMMRERLVLLNKLLSEDGSIWISIDDDECHYLKVMCDEIFGRKNFVNNIIWEKKYTLANDAKWFSDNHDHILVYAKNKDIWRPNLLPRSEEMNKAYKNPDNHPKGLWKSTPLHAKSGTEKDFEYIFKNGVKWSPPPGTFPRFSRATLEKLDENNEIWFGKDGKAIPSRKTFLIDLKKQGIPSKTIWRFDEVGHNHEAKEEVKAFNGNDVFSTPKPERLLQRIIHLATNEGDIVLDSFAGSGTTGAVAHKMRRRWIMIELGNHCFTHIIPRLKKVIDGTDKGGVSDLVSWKGGGGFTTYKLAPSLLEKDKYGNWVINKQYDTCMLAEAICKFEGFRYGPDSNVFWKQGQSTETDFIYTTTQLINQQILTDIASQMLDDETLVIYCKAFNANQNDFQDITLKKIPQAILNKCEFGIDDYSLKVEPLHEEDDELLNEGEEE